jgi:acyl carrier protein
MQEIEKQVRDFIVDNYLFGNEENAPGPETSFLEQRLIDSTGVLELVYFLEETFSIQIADEELVPENLDSLRKISAFVARKTGS